MVDVDATGATLCCSAADWCSAPEDMPRVEWMDVVVLVRCYIGKTGSSEYEVSPSLVVVVVFAF